MKMRTKGFVGSKDPSVKEYELKHRFLAREAAAEGFVLLKNEEQILPIAKGIKVGLYGAGASKTIKGGTGSGDVNERDCVSIYQGMKNAGYEITSEAWIADYDLCYDQARLDWRDAIIKKEEALNKEDPTNDSFFIAYSTMQFQVPCGNPIDEEMAANDGADVAFFVLSRVAGENADRHAVEGDYYISTEEKALLSQVCRCYQKVVLVVNTGGLVDLAFCEEYPNLVAVLQFMQAGQEGGTAFVDVVSGDKAPSGKLADTWAMTYTDYPNAGYFSFESGNVEVEEYKEGIYVGYRYFDTFEVPVRYCFGYGMTYTDFSIETEEITVENIASEQPMVSVTVKVKNVGEVYSGKEVVQVYVSCPQGKLTKEYRRLVGFAKTDLLDPQEEQTLVISFAMEQLSSYDEERAAWIYEAGEYGIFVGNSIDSSAICGALAFDGDVCLKQCEHICPMQRELEEISPDRGMLENRRALELAKVAAQGMPVVQIKADALQTKTMTYNHGKDLLNNDEIAKKAVEIVENLTLDQLVGLATGDPAMSHNEAVGGMGQSVPGAAAETSMIAVDNGVASIALADGPAGIRIQQDYQVKDGQVVKKHFRTAMEHGFLARPQDLPDNDDSCETWYQFCTAVPVGTLLAQTWNLDLVKEVGAMIADEMNMFEVTLWLAPGMNIHRNPLCGRNFEYYAEDPLLAGMMAGAITLGVQSKPGCGTTIKHFACNNQEDNRMGSDSIIHERALREIYLKNFEITVRNAQPMSIMTSYNMINGIHAANSYDICTMAARDEWGFDGAIMTDWTTTTNSTGGEVSAAGCMRAGNDMVMPGAKEDHESIRNELTDGTLSLEDLKQCVTNTVRIILRSNQYENAVSYQEGFKNLDSYMMVHLKR